MRSFLVAIMMAVAMSFVACGQREKPNEALIAAHQYYDSLLAGKYSYFIRATYLADTIPDSYREQLETNLKMFIGRMKDEHKGICGVRPLSCVHDTASQSANAFLLLTFCDSMKEEVVIPMVYRRGRWLMK